jgi:glycerol uptake facilitator-like aquaporin
VVGSGIMGEVLSPGTAAIALLANSLATAAGLYVLITTLGPVSGANFNPVVSFVLWWRGLLSPSRFAAYVPAQIVGAIVGVWIAHVMFDLPILQTSAKMRSGTGQWLSEIVATGGLLATIFLGLRANAHAVPALVAAYIGGAYWFTASTSFVNPAVTIARTVTNTFAGIRPADAPGFIAAQIIAAALVCVAMSAFSRSTQTTVPDPTAERST